LIVPLNALLPRLDVDPDAVSLVPREAVGRNVRPPEGNPHPLADGQVEKRQAETIPAFPREHPVQEIVLGIPGDRIVDESLVGEEHPVDGLDRPSRFPRSDQRGGNAPCHPADLLLDGLCIRGAAGELSHPFIGGLEERGQKRNLLVRNVRGISRPFLRCRSIAFRGPGGPAENEGRMRKGRENDARNDQDAK
jgi:hypothetical protein